MGLRDCDISKIEMMVKMRQDTIQQPGELNDVSKEFQMLADPNNKDDTTIDEF